jgi:hypothetical protein
LEHFQFSKNFDRSVHFRVQLEKLPQIVFRENDGPGNLAKRNILAGPPGTDLLVPLLQVKFVPGDEPIA